jgi:rifampicin phosphotransferase
MIYYSKNPSFKLSKNQVGSKAYNLMLLNDNGFPVPTFGVIPYDMLENANDQNNEAITNFIEKLSETKNYAVRSSACNEDSTKLSYAGQYTTYLKKTDIYEHIYKVAHSARSKVINAYESKMGNEAVDHISVIIQQMVDSDISGVGFSMHPVSHDPNTKVINALYGLGEGLVSGRYNADSFEITEGEIHATVVNKPLQISGNYKTGHGLKETDVAVRFQTMPSMTDEQIMEVANMLDNCCRIFKSPQDIEFSYCGGKLYLLQSRPITGIEAISDARATNKIIWDNSNIIESYPGVTTPLTFSFISRSYELAYKNFSLFLGLSPSLISKNEHVFKNTLGFINGRVYYNLKTWYHMLAMLPGYSVNARFMETMMGVKEKFDVPDDMIMSKQKARWRVLASSAKILWRHARLQKERTSFRTLVGNTIANYKKIKYDEKDVHEVISLYLKFESELLDNWKAPLLNDLFAMIWFGILKKEIASLSPADVKNLHNDLLCGSSDIISTQPIYRSMDIAKKIEATPLYQKLFMETDDDFIYHLIQKDKQYEELKIIIDAYIEDFGERCIGELKLETKSYKSKPQKFIQLLKSYISAKCSINDLHNDASIRANAEATLSILLKGNPLRKWWVKYVLAKTRDMVSARENLRYERSRAFGIVRELFTQIGIKMAALNVIESSDDIFYLTREEIVAYNEGRSIDQNLKQLIAVRIKENDYYKSLPHHAERITSHGFVYKDNHLYQSTEKVKVIDVLYGIGCSPGIVRAKVRKVESPDEVKNLNGEILVTHSTDPGWVVLFPSAAAIIVERGSLLSHSAIVSREMGKPCIVGVSGLMQQLSSGDVVEIDGSAGTIYVISKALNSIENSVTKES